MAIRIPTTITLGLISVILSSLLFTAEIDGTGIAGQTSAQVFHSIEHDDLMFSMGSRDRAGNANVGFGGAQGSADGSNQRSRSRSENGDANRIESSPRTGGRSGGAGGSAETAGSGAGTQRSEREVRRK